LSLEEIKEILDRFVETKGQSEVVQISGGEPTIHPQILDILAAANEREISHVTLNTNGLRLAEDPDFVKELSAYDPIIYLQFDGLTASTYHALRGCDPRVFKEKALDNLSKNGLYAILVPTIVKGINDNEIGRILHYGLKNPAVLSIIYQPITLNGRTPAQANPFDRITLTDVLQALEVQTGGLFQVDDFKPVPCPYPTCSASAYAYVDKEQVIPLSRLFNLDEYIDTANRAIPDLSAKLHPFLDALRSMTGVMGDEKAAFNPGCAACNRTENISLNLEILRNNLFMVQIHGFMDRYTFDINRLRKCCVHELTPDGRAVPFCAYNNLGYREAVKNKKEGL